MYTQISCGIGLYYTIVNTNKVILHKSTFDNINIYFQLLIGLYLNLDISSLTKNMYEF